MGVNHAEFILKGLDGCLGLNLDCLCILEVTQSAKHMKYVTESRPSSTLSMVINSSINDDENESCRVSFKIHFIYFLVFIS